MSDSGKKDNADGVVGGDPKFSNLTPGTTSADDPVDDEGVTGGLGIRGGVGGLTDTPAVDPGKVSE